MTYFMSVVKCKDKDCIKSDFLIRSDIQQIAGTKRLTVINCMIDPDRISSGAMNTKDNVTARG